PPVVGLFVFLVVYDFIVRVDHAVLAGFLGGGSGFGGGAFSGLGLLIQLLADLMELGGQFFGRLAHGGVVGALEGFPQPFDRAFHVLLLGLVHLVAQFLQGLLGV